MHDAPIEIGRRFAATPQRVFRALVTPADLIVWAWAGLGSSPGAEVDLRVGGQYCIAIDDESVTNWPRTRLSMRGIYIEIVPERRLVYTLHWDAPVFYNQAGEAVVDEVVFIDLAPADEGTLLRYLHRGVPSPEAAAAHRQGIVASHELLAKLVEG